ncbi:transposase [Streptomyces sp. NPDC005096]|uniref:transposase n=1 Tax=Streptomyces sp. NPDC005096 TaxID=3154559 RepID=UPI0033A5BBA5
MHHLQSPPCTPPQAVLVVDHFHVVQLANNTVTGVRQHTTVLHRRRRGRKGDDERNARGLLGRNREDLTDRPFAKMWNTLIKLGRMGETILTAYIAKEKLRHILSRARTHAERPLISRSCASSSPGVPTPACPNSNDSPTSSTPGGRRSRRSS